MGLVVDLIGPGGQTVNLFTSVGGAGQNFTNTTLDDAAAMPISGGGRFSGSFSPQQLLAGLIGSTPMARWTLRITDVGPQDVGTLNSWSIRLTTGETASDGPERELSIQQSGSWDVPSAGSVPAGLVATLPVPPADSYTVTIIAGGTGVTGRDFGVFATPPAVTSVVIDDNICPTLANCLLESDFLRPHSIRRGSFGRVYFEQAGGRDGHSERQHRHRRQSLRSHAHIPQRHDIRFAERWAVHTSRERQSSSKPGGREHDR